MFGQSPYQQASASVLIRTAVNQLKGDVPSYLDTLMKLASAINMNPYFATMLYDGVITDLNTLNKLANAINNDPNFNTTLISLLSAKLDITTTTDWQKYKLTESTGDAITPGLTDYDNINTSGIYGLTDGSSTLMSNAPSGFSSSAKAILKVDKYSAELLQTLINLSTKQVYIRTYSGSWQPWVLVIDSSLVGTNDGIAGLNSSGIVPDGQLPAWQRFKLSDDSGNAQTSGLTDYDTIISAGFYGLTDGSSSTMSSAPGAFSSSSNAILMVYTFSGNLFQQVVDCSGGAVYTRAYNGSTWSLW